MKLKYNNFGNQLQIYWIPIGLLLQLWIGGIKGILVNFIVIGLLTYNAIQVTKLMHYNKLKKERVKE